MLFILGGDPPAFVPTQRGAERTLMLHHCGLSRNEAFTAVKPGGFFGSPLIKSCTAPLTHGHVHGCWKTCSSLFVSVLTLKQRQHHENPKFCPSPQLTTIDHFCRSLNIKATVIRMALPTIYLFIHTHSDDESGLRWHCYEANGVRGVHSGTPPPPL